MRYNGYNVRMLRRLPALALLACALGLTQLGGALGAYPGTNGVIAYTCGANLCTIPSGGGSATTAVTGATIPSWAQGGSSVAYLTTNGIEVATYANGAVSNPLLAAGTAGATDLSLSPDATTLAYVRSNQLWTSNADGTGAQQETSMTDFIADPSWAPDGELVAYAKSTSGLSAGPYEICVLDVFATGAQPLCQTPPTGASDRHPNWSPGESSIVFDSTVGVGSPQLTTVGFGFGGFSGRTTLGAGITGSDPAYSPDGTTLVYVNGSGNLSTIPAGGGTQSPISGATGATTPDWQPLPFSSGGGGGGGTGGTGPPQNTSYPSIVLPFGRTQPLVGDTLFATVGSWSGQSPMTFTYQWKRCSPPGNFGSCFDIPKQTFSFYTATEDDYGDSIRVQVTATNSQGAASQNSPASAAVTEIAPRARVTPPVIGQNVEGQTFSVGTGTWDGTALKFTYSWRRCDPFGNFDTCVQIPGATSSTYIQTADDIGHALRVWITATNKAGSDFTITNHTFPTIPKPHFAPSSTTAPQITGVASIGESLAADTGTWGGDLPITYVYQWQRCDATGAACRNLVGQTKRKYSITSRDVGYTLRVLVTATNQYGKASATSQATDTVPAVLRHQRGRRIVGTRANDYLVGGPHDDVIYGLVGNDTIFGGGGYDTIYGGPGNDVIHVGSTGRSRVYGGPGSDTIYAQNGLRDFIDCGPGNDRAVVDTNDTVKNCEQVDVAGQTTPTPPPTTTTPIGP